MKYNYRRQHLLEKMVKKNIKDFQGFPDEVYFGYTRMWFDQGYDSFHIWEHYDTPRVLKKQKSFSFITYHALKENNFPYPFVINFFDDNAIYFEVEV